MTLSIAGRNASANAFAAAYPYISLHSATPNDSGSNETSATRIAASWSSAVEGKIEIAGPLAFTGGASNGTVTSWGCWSAATGGVFGGAVAIAAPGDTSFNSAGEYTLDSGSLTDNG